MSGCAKRTARRAWTIGLVMACTVLFGGTAHAQRMTDEEFQAAVHELGSENPEARVAAIDLLSRRAWRKRRELAPHFRRLLRQDPDWRVRASSGRAVGRLSLREAVPDLVRALRDAQVEVRVVAAAALWRLPDPAAVPALLELLHDRDPAARQWGALALGVIRDTRATQPLTQMLADSEAAVRLDTIRSLGRIGDPSGLEALVAFASDEDHAIDERLEAINAIAQLQGPNKVNALTRMLAQRNRLVRLQVVRAIGEVGDALVLPALRRLGAEERDQEISAAIHEAVDSVEERMRAAAQASSGEGATPAATRGH
jgi:HEAT repeat protein